MPEIIETTEISENCETILEQNRSLHENTKINGYVTVIKNKGKCNEEVIQKNKPNLLTTSGRDFYHAQDYTNTSAGTKGSNAMAISADATDPVAGDTTLVGEITTGGLTRVQATTITHTVGTNVTTLAVTYTATAIHTALHKAGLFNQNGLGGQMTHASEFLADVTLQIGDTLTVTWTNTLG